MNVLLITKNTKNTKGFTLIEAMIAMLILTIGILVVVTMQKTSIVSNSKAQRITNASTLAADMTERIIALPFNAATNNRDDDCDGLVDELDEDILDAGKSPYTLASFSANGCDDDNDGEVDEADEGDPRGYQIQWTVRDNTPHAGVKTITLTVSYTSHEGNKIRAVSLNSLKTPY